MLSKSAIENFFVGKSNFKNYFKSIYFSSALMILISILSQLLFPDQFYFWNHSVSSQGSILKNPIGNIFWRSGIIIIALLKFPDVMFISKKLKVVSKKYSEISRICGLIASLAFVFVGIFPEEIKPIHGISAFICFAGYFAMININFGIINKEIKNKHSLNYKHLIKNREKIRLLFIVLNNGFFFMVISSIFKVFVGFFPLWELFFLFSLILWFLMFPTFIVADNDVIIFEINSSEIVHKFRSNEIFNKIRAKVVEAPMLSIGVFFIFSSLVLNSKFDSDIIKSGR